MAVKGFTVNLDSFANLAWFEPWHPVPAGLEAELAREISPGHPLFGQKAISVARRNDCDDVLFLLPDNAYPLAVVHLTWTGQGEKKREWPHTTFYVSLEDWAERCMSPNHREGTGAA